MEDAINKEDVLKAIQAIKGKYTFKSPYHKRNKRLAFIVKGYSFDERYPVDVETVEYKGYKKSEVRAGYQLKTIQDWIATGFLQRATN